MIIDFEKNLSEAYGLFCFTKMFNDLCCCIKLARINFLFHGKTVHWKVFFLVFPRFPRPHIKPMLILGWTNKLHFTIKLKTEPQILIQALCQCSFYFLLFYINHSVAWDLSTSTFWHWKPCWWTTDRGGNWRWEWIICSSRYKKR